MPDIRQWLDSLGLGQYAEAFEENEIDLEVLPHLDHEVLKDVGVKAAGHRVRILKAAESLKSEQTTEEQEVSPPPDSTPEPAAKGEAERRQLTVMFCDLVGSTELSQRLDPEELREVMSSFQNCCAEVISRYGGFIARYMGDGILVYFGYPLAHEDDAERAIHASLGVVESVGSLDAGPQNIELGVRVGIATGPVVVGDLIGEGAAQESAVIGETPNLAARLQGMADRNAVLIAPRTHELAGARFEYSDLGAHSLKGITEPVQVWQVIAPAAIASRFEAAHRTGLTPLVGREQEIGLLLERWAQAAEGDGQVVLLSGEAGIGKSRVTETLRERVAGDDPIRLRYQCSPHHTYTVLHPVIEQLERAARINNEDTNEVKLDKLESLLHQGATDVETLAPLFAPLLSIPIEGRYPPLEMTPERQKEQTLEALVTQMEGLSCQHPVLLIFEDIHWADPTSLELLELTINHVQRIPVLVVLTYRPEFTPPWSGYTHVTSLTLNRFTRSLARTMVDKVAGGESLPDEVLEQIIEKTDGVPLFVEELTKTILESGRLSGVAIPTTLHDSLMARLDRLGAVKEVAQTASAIGREFGFDLLAMVSPLSFAALHNALGQLIDAELVFRRTRRQKEAFIFKHALVQDAAYQSLLKSTRRQLHQRIAEALESRFSETAEAQPELLAHHFSAAGYAEEAAKYWLQAGSTAAERTANQEAIGHLTEGLSVLLKVPESTARLQRELDFQSQLCGPYMSTKGWGGEETAVTFARARELCTLLGETEQLPPVLNGEYMRELSNGRFLAAREAAAELLRFGEQQQDPGAILVGHRILGWASMYLGEFSDSRTHIDEALRLYDPEQHGGLKLRYAHDTRVASLCVRAMLQCICGYPDQASITTKAAIEYARSIEHAPSLAYAVLFAGAFPAALRGDPRQAAEFSEELLILSERLGSALWLAYGRVMAGWSAAVLKLHEDGVQLFLQGLEDLEAAAPNPWRPIFLTLLAELYLDRGETDQARVTLENALQLVARTEERMWEAGIHILLSKTLLAYDPPNAQEAEASLRRGVGVAQRQGAKTLELRAATSIARLWRRQDKLGDARGLLTPIYNWFTEGFDTPELREAKALLDQLS